MQVYRYDGTFEGFLSALARCFSDQSAPSDFIKASNKTPEGLFRCFTTEVPSDRESALQFRQHFRNTVSKEAFTTLSYAFQSEAPGVEMLLWSYARKGFEHGSQLANHIAEPDIYQVGKLARTVAREAHRYKGFVRFREVSHCFFYASIEPQSDILAILAQHFADRLRDRPWFLHDLRRSQAIVFDTTRWRLVRNVAQISAPQFTTHELDCNELWQSYFSHLGIDERRNPKLQQQHVPLRAREHMVEFHPKSMKHN